MKVRVKCGDSMSNRSRDIGLSHFVTNDDDNDDAGHHLTAFCLKTAHITLVVVAVVVVKI